MPLSNGKRYAKKQSKPKATKPKQSSNNAQQTATLSPETPELNPAIQSPEQMLQLQRLIGNQGVRQLIREGGYGLPSQQDNINADTAVPPELVPVNQLQRSAFDQPADPRFFTPIAMVNGAYRPVTGGSPTLQRQPDKSGAAPDVQREGGKDSLTPAGNNYEKKVEYKGDRWSFSLSFSFSRAKPNPTKSKAGAFSGQLGDTKMSSAKSYSKGAAKAGRSMSMALAKAGVDIVELMPGVKVYAEMKALEAKLEKGEVDVDVLKIAFGVSGTLTKAIQGTAVGDAIMSTSLGEVIMEGTAIKVTGKIEIKVDPADAARLVRMAQLNKQLVENTKMAKQMQGKIDKIAAENKKIKQQLKRGSKVKPKKRKILNNRLKNNKAKLRKLAGKMDKIKGANKGLRKLYSAAAKGLKSKAGRAVGGIIKKVGGKLLARVIPGIGWLLTAMDVLEAGYLIYQVIAGNAKFGFGGDSSGKGGGSEEGAGGSGGEGGELGPEVDISTEEGFEPATGASGKGGEGTGKEAKPQLHPAAQALWDIIKSTEKDGVKFTNDDLAQLNSVVPKDISGEHLAKLLDWAKIREGQKLTDVFAILGAIQGKIAEIRSGDEKVTVTGTDGSQEQMPIEEVDGSAASGEKKDKDAKDIDPEKVKKFIESAKGTMNSKGLITMYHLPENTKAEDLKANSTLQGWMAFKHNGKFFAGYAMMIVTKPPSGGKITVHIQPVTLYDEAGVKRGVTKALDMEMNVF